MVVVCTRLTVIIIFHKMASAKRFSREEYDHLCRMIQRWNENRVELFEISKPNEVGRSAVVWCAVVAFPSLCVAPARTYVSLLDKAETKSLAASTTMEQRTDRL